jgi:hypothetical protein
VKQKCLLCDRKGERANVTPSTQEAPLMRLSVASLRRMIKGKLHVEFVHQELTSYSGLELLRRYLRQLDLPRRLRAACASTGGDRAERILEAARMLSDAREADDEAGSAARLITALQKVAADVGLAATPTRLLEALQDNGYAWVKSTRRLAGLLAPLGLVARPGRENGRPVRLYTLEPGVLADLSRRYNPTVAAASGGHHRSGDSGWRFLFRYP